MSSTNRKFFCGAPAQQPEAERAGDGVVGVALVLAHVALEAEAATFGDAATRRIRVVAPEADAVGAEILEAFGCWVDTPCLGVTATLTRTDGKGLGDIFEKVSYEKDILFGIDNGYLTDVRGQQVTVDGLDLATIARSRGDYQEGQLGEAMMASGW